MSKNDNARVSLPGVLLNYGVHTYIIHVQLGVMGQNPYRSSNDRIWLTLDSLCGHHRRDRLAYRVSHNLVEHLGSHEAEQDDLDEHAVAGHIDLELLVAEPAP